MEGEVTGPQRNLGEPFPKPNLTGSTTINLRTASHAHLTSGLGLSNYFAKAVREILRDNPSYDVADLISGLKNMEDLDPGSSGRRGASEQRKGAGMILNKERVGFTRELKANRRNVPTMTDLSQPEQEWLATLDELRAHPEIEVSEEYRGKLRQGVGDADKAFAELAEWDGITLSES